MYVIKVICIKLQTKLSAGLVVTVVVTGDGTGSFQTVILKLFKPENICHTFIQLS